MRNLLGRLNARSAEELHRVGRFWGVTLSGGERGRHVGVLYRTMTDVRAVRDAWDRLDPDEQALVAALALGDGEALTVADLAEHVGLPEAATRDAANRLFRAGILTREGDNQELPVGALPRLLLPRELMSLFRRVQDEIDAGDLSGSPPRVLLELLDDAELEEAAGIWGTKVIPGLRRRVELNDQILKQIAGAERIERVIAALGRDAAAVCRVVRAADGRAVPLADALRDAGLAGQADDFRRFERIRRALTELETALLVWHTYRGDGSRWLFAPREVLHPGEGDAVDEPAIQSFVPATVEVAPPRHPHALAWDLLTVLRELSTHGGPLWIPGEALARSWQRRLNDRLWFAGEEAPPTGYLAFLLHLAFGTGVVEPGERAPGEPKGAVRPVPAETLRSWRGHPFAEQTARLRSAWLAGDEWEEGRERQEVEVWGADWRGFRHKLRHALEHMPEDEWLPVEDAARLLAEADPALLGATFTAASARATASDRGDREAARSATVARVVAIELETAFAWFGLVEIGRVPGTGPALRVTEAGRRAARDDAGKPGMSGLPGLTGEAPAADGPPLTIDEAGLVTLRQPSPLRVWALSAFGDQESLWPEASYRLRPASVGRALGAGFDREQIVTFLERQSEAALPASLATALREWTTGYRRVRLRRAVLLLPDTPAARDELRRALGALKNAGIEVAEATKEDTPQGLIVLLPATGDDASAAEAVLLTALRDAGYSGQWQRVPVSGPPFSKRSPHGSRQGSD
ncbi:MAG: helicase-associated domain-containing protein [Chloroflexia bacterium]|nr:helicase-associated domain-containing protein [Chloroflexia bacterium]